MPSKVGLHRWLCPLCFLMTFDGEDKNLAPGVDLSAVARQTPGMSGADLANLLNEGRECCLGSGVGSKVGILLLHS